MTKENLRDLFCKQLNSSQHWGDLSIFDEFFESNVVIPRGAIIECNIANTWYDTDLYRIKPSEPVYEWQWVYVHNGQAIMILGNTGFYTDDEIENNGNDKYIKIEETKRERR